MADDKKKEGKKQEKPKPLSDNQMDQVAGGAGKPTTPPPSSDGQGN